MPENFTRVLPETRELLRWAEAKAVDSNQSYIDTHHLLLACQLNQSIRDWLRKIPVSVEGAYLLTTLELPQTTAPEEEEDFETEVAELLNYLESGEEQHKDIEGLTERAKKAILLGGTEMAKFGNYYFHPIHVFAGVVKADGDLAERVLVREELPRQKLLQEIEAEVRRVRLSETLTDLENHFKIMDLDFAEKLKLAKHIEGLIRGNNPE